MNKSFKIALISLVVVPVVTFSLMVYFSGNVVVGHQKKKATQIPEEYRSNLKEEFEVMWKSLPVPTATNDLGEPDIPIDSQGRIKPHIIKSESEVRYLINNLEKNEIYPKILKSFYFYRNVPGQWDKKKAIGLINARMKTMPAGESKLWFQLAGVDAYARRYTKDVPDPGPSYVLIFKHAKKLSELDVELFYRLIKEMTYEPSPFANVRKPREPRYLNQIILELLPAYLSVKVLSDKEPGLTNVAPYMMKPFLKKFDERKDRSFNEIYRSMLISQPIDILEKRLPQLLVHPEFVSQSDNIKRRLYSHMALRYCIDEYARDKQLMWLEKYVNAGGGYSRLLSFYCSYISFAFSKDRTQKKLEKEFAYLHNDGAAGKANLVYHDKKNLQFTREIANYIEKKYVVGDRQQNVKLDNELRIKYPNMYGPIQYLKLVDLQKNEQGRKKMVTDYKKACDKAFKKALRDSSRSFDALEMFKFMKRMQMENQGYKYLDEMIDHLQDPSELRLRLAYIVVSKYKKNYQQKALSVLDKIDLSKYDTSNGGTLAFRVKMISNLKLGLKKQKIQSSKK